MICPKVEKSVPVSSTTSPVTHTAEVEVNNAFSHPTLAPVDEDTGKDNIIVPIKIVITKPKRIILEEDRLSFRVNTRYFFDNILLAPVIIQFVNTLLRVMIFQIIKQKLVNHTR